MLGGIGYASCSLSFPVSTFLWIVLVRLDGEITVATTCHCKQPIFEETLGLAAFLMGLFLLAVRW